MKFFILSILILVGCTTNKMIVESPHKEHKLKIVDKGGFRMIYDFRESKEKSYVKLDVRNVPRISDALFVCWENEQGKLEILYPGSIIVENYLPESEFNILTAHITDEKGLPIIMKYHTENCFDLDFETRKVFPRNSAKIK